MSDIGEHDPARTYLNSVRALRVEQERLRLHSEELMTRCAKMTASLTGMPRGGGDGIEALWALLADEDRDYVERLRETRARVAEVEGFIDRTDATDLQKEILKLRYLECMDWRTVQKTLRKSGSWYEERQVFEHHGRALNCARELWEKEHKEETV
jgi:hypothetical protein